MTVSCNTPPPASSLRAWIICRHHCIIKAWIICRYYCRYYCRHCCSLIKISFHALFYHFRPISSTTTARSGALTDGNRADQTARRPRAGGYRDRLTRPELAISGFVAQKATFPKSPKIKKTRLSSSSPDRVITSAANAAPH